MNINCYVLERDDAMSRRKKKRVQKRNGARKLPDTKVQSSVHLPARAQFLALRKYFSPDRSALKISEVAILS